MQIQSGEFVGILGPSGFGNFNLLNIPAGIDLARQREVITNGTCLQEYNKYQLSRWLGRHVGVVFQFFQLLLTLTLRENVMLPVSLQTRMNIRCFCAPHPPRRKSTPKNGCRTLAVAGRWKDGGTEFQSRQRR